MGHAGVGWVMQGWGGSCSHVGVRWGGSCMCGVGHVEVGVGR